MFLCDSLNTNWNVRLLLFPYLKRISFHHLIKSQQNEQNPAKTWLRFRYTLFTIMCVFSCTDCASNIPHANPNKARCH